MDQVTFQNRQDSKIEYSNVRENIKVVIQKQMFDPVILNMAVSAQNGIEAYRFYNKAMNSQQLCQIFDDINMKGNHYIVLCDNSSI
jgi:hypothetical protein